MNEAKQDDYLQQKEEKSRKKRIIIRRRKHSKIKRRERKRRKKKRQKEEEDLAITPGPRNRTLGEHGASQIERQITLWLERAESAAAFDSSP